MTNNRIPRPNHSDPTLFLLERKELSAITFVRDYIQLHFDGPILNLYVWPNVKSSTFGRFEHNTSGYRDALCGQIGKLVVAAVIDPTNQISLHFDNDTVISISLNREHRIGEEAAMLQDENGRHWNVW